MVAFSYAEQAQFDFSRHFFRGSRLLSFLIDYRASIGITCSIDHYYKYQKLYVVLVYKSYLILATKQMQRRFCEIE